MGANPNARILPLAVAIGFLLAGCGSSPGPEAGANHLSSRGYYKVGAPYVVKGVRYYPRVDYNYDQRGEASWYGEAFHRKPTANGEIFDLNQMTAAHKTLQLPSIVEVTNLRNGRVVQLRVNDRGPFIGERIIDVSRRAAQLLGFEGAGTAPVRVRILKEESIQVAEAAMRGEIGQVRVAQAPRSRPLEMAAPRRPAAASAPVTRVAAVTAPPLPLPLPLPPPPLPSPPNPAPPPQNVAAPLPVAPAPPPSAPRRQWPSLISSAHAASPPVPSAPPGSGRIFIQAGAFAVPENAQRVRMRVAALGNTEVLRTTLNGTALYRVRVGPVASEAEARRLLHRVVDSGYPEARVVDD
jgi:rare lipoprotein A